VVGAVIGGYISFFFLFFLPPAFRLVFFFSFSFAVHPYVCACFPGISFKFCPEFRVGGFFYFFIFYFYCFIVPLCVALFFSHLSFLLWVGFFFSFSFRFFLFYFMRDGTTKYVATSLRGTGENLQIRSIVKNEIKDIAALRFEKGGV